MEKKTKVVHKFLTLAEGNIGGILSGPARKNLVPGVWYPLEEFDQSLAGRLQTSGVMVLVTKEV